MSDYERSKVPPTDPETQAFIDRAVLSSEINRRYAEKRARQEAARVAKESK